MTKTLKKVLLITELFFFSVLLFGQSNFHYTSFSTADGLAHNEIQSFFMDSKGYMWIGTADGLSRFDGVEFLNFRPNEKDSTSIDGNNISQIVEDQNGFLWIGTKGGGLNRYDPATETFTNFQHQKNVEGSLPNNFLHGIYLDWDGNIWIGFEQGRIGKFNPVTTFCESYIIQENADQLPASQQDIFLTFQADPLDPNTLWVQGLTGLFEFNLSTKKAEYYAHKSDRNFMTMSLLIDSSNDIWVGTWSHGLAKFDRKKKTYKYYPPIPEKFFPYPSYSTNIVLDINQKSPTELWIAGRTFGIGIFNIETEQFQLLDINIPNSFSPYENRSETIYEDQAGRLWMAHYKSGCTILDPNDQYFQFVSFAPQEGTIQFDHIEPKDFAIDPSNGHLFVSTFAGNGLFEFDPQYRLINTIQSSYITSPNYKYSYKDLLISQDGNIWTLDVTHNTLLLLDKASNQLHPVKKDELHQLLKRLNENLLEKIIEDKNGNIWIIANESGLIKYDRKNNQLQKYIDDAIDGKGITDKMDLTDIAIDEDGDFWIVTRDHGLFFFDLKKEKFISDDVLSLSLNGVPIPNHLTSISIDKDQNIWLGTRSNGAIKVNLKSKKTKAYGYSEGLPNLKIQKSICDSSGTIWMTTTNGLVRFNPNTEQFQSFGKQEGIKDVILNYGLSTTKDGSIFIGQNLGFYHFHPDRIKINEEAPSLVFKDLTTAGKNKELGRSLNYIEELELPYDENFFSVSFAALNFTKVEKNQYAYLLEGYDKNWNYVGNQNIANYTNVREGSYTFRVKAANSDGVWNEEGINFKLRVLPPWYRAWWAYLIYTAAAFLLFFYAYDFQRNRWQMQTQLQLEKAEAMRLKELDAVKSRLYTNLTHEFRTPLTVIKGMAENTDQNLDPKLNDRFRLIQKNSDQLLSLVNQLLDLSKLQQGTLQLKHEQGDIITYVKYLVESLQSLASTQHKQLLFSSNVAHYLMDYDPKHLQSITVNLISNAIKFTQAKDVIEVKIEIQKAEQQLEIKVTDTGKGIPSNQLENIFDRFYQVEDSNTRTQDGTGIGLALVKELVGLMNGKISVESQLEIGSSFTVNLPISQTANLVSDQLIGLPKQDSDTIKIEEGISQRTDKSNENLPLLLIVEDNADVVHYLKTCLHSKYQISIANDGEEGIEKAIDLIPDIIISDVMMPKKDGYELCYLLKENEKTSHIPIIMLTAKATLEDRLEGLRKGADAYLPKPFNKEELLIRLAQLLQLRKKVQAYYAGVSTSFPTEIPIQKENEFLKKVNDIIEENLSDENFKTPQLCQALFYSKMQVHRKLKALTDKNTSQYLRDYRLQKAKVLLEQGADSITTVAFNVGFNSIPYFSRSFKEKYGIPPSDYFKRSTR